MENDRFEAMQNNAMQKSPNSSSNSRFPLTIFWVISLIIIGLLGFIFGKGITSENAKTKVLGEKKEDLSIQIPTAIPSQSPSPSPSPTQQNIVKIQPITETSPTLSPVNTLPCSKNGFAQKWEYLISYVLKENDTLQSIATEQLKDSSRVNEILQINGVGPLVNGATLYLPPPSVTKSSGNLKQIYGKLVEKNTATWHIGFSTNRDGQGVFIPAFFFEELSNSDSFKIGDCLKIFLDDGYKVYSVSSQ